MMKTGVSAAWSLRSIVFASPASDPDYPNSRSPIDTHGFMIHYHQSAVPDFQNRTEVEDLDLSEIEALLRSTLERVDKVFIFNWRGSLPRPSPG